MDESLAHLRMEYDGAGLRAAEAGSDPMQLFTAWFAEAAERDTVVEANAMTLATATGDGAPSARMVLLKGIDPARAAFTWYTNLDSRKAREAAASGRAALCWWWPGPHGRQVRAAGRVELVPREEAESYFATRPAAARVGAAVSHQSRPIVDRSTLDARAAAIDPETVTLPERWGGMRLVADELEFWQGRTGRLHDRIVFLRLDAVGEPCSEAAAEAAQDGTADESLDACGTRVVDAHGAAWLRVRLQP